jgi:DNA-binding MarR family transcriptional regulator
MKLETELKNTRPLAPHPRALLNILFTASWLDCLQTRQMRSFGLTPPQYNILRILNGSAPKGLSVLDIKSRMIDRSSNVSRLVEKLKQADLAERIPHQDDRRMVIVTISEKGKKLLADIEASGIFEEKMPGKALTEAEAMELAHLLDKFRE